MNKRNRSIYTFGLTVPALLIYTFFVIVPILMSVHYSFTDWNIRRWTSAEWIGFINYIEILKDSVFITSLKNTFLYAFATATLKIVFGLTLALILSKPFKGNSIFRTVFYMPCVLSCTVIGVLFTAMLGQNGLINNILRDLNLTGLQAEWLGSYKTAMSWIILIESWMWSGFNMFIFISGIQAIPSDYYEAAETEGASWWKQFTKITLPLLVPAITVNVTLNIAGGMKVFDIIYVLTNGGPGTDTQVLSTYAFRTFGLGFLGQSCAASIILTILVIIISFIMNKYLRSREVEL